VGVILLTGDLSLTTRIRAEARRLGFFKMGVAPAGSLPWRSRFDEWLAQGMQGSMAYLERQAEKRRTTELVLESVRSILVLAMNYHARAVAMDDPLRGRISQYAWGKDYHGLMTGRLHALLDFILREEAGARGLFYSDTGPVMEKVWGAHSALGWMGKHSNLITREEGSWFFIGVVLLDLKLQYDKPEKDYCGSCTRCIHACPTAAIVAPYVVDARRCISYLTIELKEFIPRELRPLIGNRIFGCDDCQDVCPWNRFAVTTPEKAFWPRDGNAFPELARLALLTEQEFNTRFKDSPIRRAKRDNFVRNVVVALGNSHRAEAAPPLVRALKDASTIVRAHAAWALGQIASHQISGLRPQTSDQRQHKVTAAIRSALTEARRAEHDREVREEIELSLTGLEPQSKNQYMEEFL
jgi:epoxyqueuosine reductase